MKGEVTMTFTFTNLEKNELDMLYAIEDEYPNDISSRRVEEALDGNQIYEFVVRDLPQIIIAIITVLEYIKQNRKIEKLEEELKMVIEQINDSSSKKITLDELKDSVNYGKN